MVDHSDYWTQSQSVAPHTVNPNANPDRSQSQGPNYVTGVLGTDHYRNRDAENLREDYRGKGPKNYKRGDHSIQEEICEKLTHDSFVDASHIEVNVNGGIVELVGRVPNRLTKKHAEEITDTVSGVRDVVNQLQISEGL